jgi:hypothetical protein
MATFQRSQAQLKHMLGSIGIKTIQVKRPNLIGFGARNNILKGEFI